MRLFESTTSSRSAGLLILIMTTFSLFGCNSLVNPYLQFGDRPTVEQKAGSSTSVSPIPIATAVAYANRVKDRYRQAIGDDATFNRLLGAGLIGTATTLPIMALNEASTKSTGIVGVSGAGVYALNAWFQSEPRQRAYIQGYNAVNCAVAVMLPLAFDQTQEPYKSFHMAVKGIVSKIHALEGDIPNVEISIENLAREQETAKKLSRQMVASARTAITEAKEARRRGLEIQTRIAGGGGRLISTVDRIIGEVDMAIQANASDLSTLPGIISGLGGIYGEFPGAPAISVFGRSGPQYRDESDTTQGAVAELARKTAAVAADTLVISDFVSALAVARPVESLKSCRVDPESITMAMSIHPNSASFSSVRDETRPFLVQGGAFPYMMSIRGTASNLISVDQPAGFGPSFTITVKSGAPAGLYAIHVADGSRRIAWLPVEVLGTGTSEDRSDDTGATTPGGEAFGKLDPNQRKQVQRALCVDDDGEWGPDTRAALERYAGSADSTDDNMQEQLTLSEAAVAARCSKGGATPSPDQSLREALERASRAAKDQSIDLAAPAGYTVTVTESKIFEASDDLGLSVTISIHAPDGKAPATKVKASAIRKAIIERLQESSITPDHVRIANLSKLVSDSEVSND